MFHIYYKQKSFTAISDTHGKHRDVLIPKSDFLIHCGDACTDGNENELLDFFQWFAVQPARYKIFVAGNHDLVFDLEPERSIDFIPKNIIYLENESKMIDGIMFYAVAARPWLHEAPLYGKDIDFLLTHGPAHAILD